jgi:hypothetical protein
VDRRFLREHAVYLSHNVVLLYFFLCAVANKHGLLFHGDGTMTTLVRISPPALVAARAESLARDLIAYETHFTQVLSLPAAGQCRCSEPSQGLMTLGEILHRAAALLHVDGKRSLP